MNHHPPLSQVRQIDAQCDRFEADWKAGKNPKIEDFLTSAEGDQRSSLLRALMQVELELLSKSDRKVSQQDYVQRFPDDSDLVEELFRTSDTEPRDKTLSMAKPAVDTSQLDRSILPKQPVKGEPQQIGRFRILSTLGRGAFGKVYKAYDPQLDREVALKVPKAGMLETEHDVERFLREAKAAAAIHHRNICPVYETGQIDGHYYIVMAYIEGRTLAEAIRETERHDPIRVSSLMHKVAVALEAAHEQGIVHRDLKPANIMIDKQGEPIVMDFGLARRNETEDAKLTHSGQILGTPAYMSPEQARGDVENLDARSDVYSLGVILYEMLCGTVPFRGSVAEVLSRILNEDPKPPSEIRSKVDNHLELVCLKAIAKEADDRFTSMGEMAAALAGEMETVDIRLPARRVKFRARLRRWSMIGLAAAFLLLLLGVIIYIRTDYGTVKIEVHDPNLQVTVDNNVITFKDGEQTIRLRRGKKRIKLETLDQNGKVIHTKIEEIKIGRGKQLQVHVALDENGKIAVIYGNDPLPDWLQQKIAARDGPVIGPAPPTTPLPDGPPGQSRQFTSTGTIDVALSSDSRLAICTLHHGATIWDLATEKTITTIDSEKNWVWCVDLSPDGRYAVIGTVDHNLYLHDAKTGERLRTIAGHEGNLVTVKFTPDSKQMVSWAFDGTLRVWDVANGKQVRKIDVNTTRELFEIYTRQVHFSHDARLAAVAALDNLVELWDVQTGNRLAQFKGHTDKTIAAAVSRDGKRVVSTALDRTIRLWDAQSGKQLNEIPDLGTRIASVEFTPDGRWFAASLYDGTLRFWDSKTGDEKYRTAIVDGKYPASAIRLAFTPDGRFLMTAASDVTLRMWRLPTPTQLASGLPLPEAKIAGDISDPSPYAANELRRFPCRGVFSKVSISPDGRLGVWSQSQHQFVIWDLETGREIRHFNTSPEWTHNVLYSPDAKSILAFHNGFVSLWNADNGKRLLQCELKTDDGKPTKESVTAAAFSPDGKHIIAGDANGVICLWDAQTGKYLRNLAGHTGYIKAFSFTSDGRRVATGAALHGRNKAIENHVLRLWDVESGKEIRRFSGAHPEAADVQFAADDRTIYCAVVTGTIGVWDAETGEMTARFVGNEKDMRNIDISSDGKRIVSAGLSGIVRVWDIETKRTIHQYPYPNAEGVWDVKFLPDDRRFLTSGRAESDVVRLWRVPNVGGEPPSTDGNELRLPVGQWVQLLENEQQLKDWKTLNGEPTIADGTVTLQSGAVKGKPLYGKVLTRELSTEAKRFIVHVRHKKVSGFGMSESIHVGSMGIDVSHFGASNHELWENYQKKTAVHVSQDGEGEFADCDYVVIDGEYTAYLNGKKMFGLSVPDEPLTKIRLSVRRALGEWREIAVLQLSDAQVEAIRGGTLPKFSRGVPPPAQAPFNAAQAKAHQQAWAEHLGLQVEVANSIGMEFRLIPPGKYQMGTSRDQFAKVVDRYGDWYTGRREMPISSVTITKPFLIGKHEVTQNDYEQIMGGNPSYFSSLGGGRNKVSFQDTPKHPVEQVSWYDAIEFCNRLSKKENLPPYYEVNGLVVRALGGEGYRLPTEAEWEYSCRAGTETHFSFGDDPTDYAQYAWRSNQSTGAVGQKLPNQFGIYDMHGNVFEWCYSGMGNYAKLSTLVDPVDNPTTSQWRALRGGAHTSNAYQARTAFRSGNPPISKEKHIGFRVVRNAPNIKAASKKSAPIPAAAIVGDAALSFDGQDDYILTPSLKYDGSHPLTIEMTVTPHAVKPSKTTDGRRATPTVIGDWIWNSNKGFGLALRPDNSCWNLGFQDEATGKYLDAISTAPAKANQKVQIAGTFDGKIARLFVDGKLVASSKQIEKYVPAENSLLIGATRTLDGKMENYFHGIIDEMRISKVVRYTKDYTPETQLKTDDNTLALYHCDDGEGNVLKDSSANGNDGIILGAKWVKAEDLAPSAANAPFDATQARALQRAWADYLGVPVEKTGGAGIKFRLIPPGEYRMGSDKEELAELFEGGKKYGKAWTDLVLTEGPQHTVRITRPFYLSVNEVTVGQFKQFVASAKYVSDREKPQDNSLPTWKDPGFAQDDSHPVVEVSWNDAVAFTRWLQSQETGSVYRLPSEAEWEYAARAGSQSRWHFGDSDADIAQYAWHGKGKTQVVGLLKPNAFGLYDIHGNAWEWCADWLGDDYYKHSPQNDPPGPKTGTVHVRRGGSCSNCEWGVHIALRYRKTSYPAPTGFRVVLDVPGYKATTTKSE